MNLREFYRQFRITRYAAMETQAESMVDVTVFVNGVHLPIDEVTLMPGGISIVAGSSIKEAPSEPS